MRKGWFVLLTAVLAVALAAPAMADVKITGSYAFKGMISNYFDGSGGPSIRTDDAEQTNAYAEQRARIKFDGGTDSARVVFHFESDMNWGVGSGNSYVSVAEAEDDDGNGLGWADPGNYAVSNGRNGGGALSADATQLETKEVYLWFKIPDTSLTAKVGMQSVPDHYAGVFSNSADMTGIFVNGQFEPVKFMLGWAKLYETNGGGGSGGYDGADDTTLYVAGVSFVPAKDMSLGVNLYYVQDDSGKNNSESARLDPLQGLGGDPLNGYKVDLYMPGVNFAMNAGIAKISAFAFYQFGEAKAWNGADFDINAFMIDLRADLKVGPGNLFVEGFYVSGGDGADGDYESIITLGDYQRSTAGAKNDGTGGNSGFGRTNMYFLFGADSVNVSQCIIGCSGGELGDSLGNSGRGLWHIAAGYSQKFTDKLKGAVNVGTLYAVDTYAADDKANSPDLWASRDKDIATEFNARIDYEISKGLTASLVGSYLLLGDFIQSSVADDGAEFNDGYYMGYAKLAYRF